MWDGSPPVGSRGGAPVEGLGDEVPQVQGLSPGRDTGGRSPQRGPGAMLFCETTHNICIKIQQTTVAGNRVHILNDITSKIFGGDITMNVPPS